MIDRTPRKPLIPTNTDLTGIAFTLKPERELSLHPQYTTQLHGWLLHQIRCINPELSQQLHDGQGEKAFTISQLQGEIIAQGRELYLNAQNTYQWQVTALSRPLCDGLRQWLDRPPARLELSSGNYRILDVRACNPPTTYAEIWRRSEFSKTPLELTFSSATSFRKRGNHLPLPIPENLFHSYLRRWNHFASEQFEQDPFLEWVNDNIVILRHDIRSIKVQAGKSGSVTGFVGSVQLGFTSKAKQQPRYIQLVHALIACAPYFNTGHKVTFGLGNTQLGWDVETDLSHPQPLDGLPSGDLSVAAEIYPPRPTGTPPWRGFPSQPPSPDHEEGVRVTLDQGVWEGNTISATTQRNDRSIAASLAEDRVNLIATREQELEPFFLSQKKRQGGERAIKTAKLWAQIIARLEQGDSLRSISTELNMPYDTVKKYAQIAKQKLDGANLQK
jgi:CRISPR-associated endoribonuclease Cas6